jgi:chemotaxis protein MotB
VLKQYPDRTIHIASHIDNFPIRDVLARTFPTNMELCQARADSAKQALIEGGMTSDNIEALGHADSRPVPAIRPARAARKIGASTSL